MNGLLIGIGWFASFMKTDLDKEGYYKKPVIVGKCPLCGSPVETIRPWGHMYCTKDSCPYDTS